MADAFQLYNLVVGVLSATGLLYLAYSQQFVVGYRRFFHLLIGGLLVFTIGGPMADLFAPSFTHAVHGLAALMVSLGLYDPVHNNLRKDEWARLLLQEPSELRYPGEWMVTMDDDFPNLRNGS